MEHWQYIAESVEVQSVYDRYQDYLAQLYFQEGLLALALLEQKLVDLSLQEKASSTALEEALIAVSPNRRRTFMSVEEGNFLRDLYHAIHDLWTRPPWCYSNVVIYQATRRLHTHGFLIVEIAYGTFLAHAPPASSA